MSLAVRSGCWFRGEQVEVRLGWLSAWPDGQAPRAVLPFRDPGALAERLAGAGYPVTPIGGATADGGFRSVDPHGNLLEFVAG